MFTQYTIHLTSSLSTVWQIWCFRTGSYETVLNRTHPAALLKLDIRYKTLVTYQSFDCIIKVQILSVFYVIQTLWYQLSFPPSRVPWTAIEINWHDTLETFWPGVTQGDEWNPAFYIIHCLGEDWVPQQVSGVLQRERRCGRHDVWHQPRIPQVNI